MAQTISACLARIQDYFEGGQFAFRCRVRLCCWLHSRRAPIRLNKAIIAKDRQMMSDGGTFVLPDQLEGDLERVYAYWNGLKRGDNDIPFWDDVKFSMRARLAREVMVIEAFKNRLRFRFDLVGEDLTRRYGACLGGKFTDEVDLHSPIDRLTEQCRATVERRAPTFFRHAPTQSGVGYSRLVLPLWGNGHIEMLIAAICFS
jgi:hypothetical protein